MKCKECNHELEEHGKDGCYHLEYEKDKDGNETEKLTACECSKTPAQIQQQEG